MADTLKLSAVVAVENHIRAILHELTELQLSGDRTTLGACGVSLAELVSEARELYRSTEGQPKPQAHPISTWNHGEAQEVQGAGLENPVDGFYTVAFPDGDHRTYRLETKPEGSSFAPGKQVAYYLNGPDNWQNYKGFAFIVDGSAKLWRSAPSNDSKTIAGIHILLSGRDAMIDGLKGYAMQSGKCGVCGRMLTTPESIAAGIGPVCAEKIGL